jgi:TrmH family RNA methyltransferase
VVSPRAPELVSSRDNRWLKTFRAALQRGEPTPEGFIGVEGPHLVAEALRAGLEVSAVLVSISGEPLLEELAPTLGPSIRRLKTSDRLFAAVSDTRAPQGIAALVRPHRADLDELLRGVPLLLVLVAVQDPGNVGTILRSSEAFGATGAVICAGTAHPSTPKVLRASAGSALRVPVASGPAPPILLAQLRVAGVRSYAATLGPGVEPRAADLRAAAALFIGNEGAGLPPEIERSADARIRIPLAAGVDSLNAAVAASILLYEAASQRAEAR